MNMLTDSPPMITSVRAALRLLGLRKAGTPLLIASTPVSAVQPDAKARIARKTVNSPPTCTVRGSASCALTASGSPSAQNGPPGGEGEQQPHTDDEAVGGNGERLPALPHAAQVDQRDEHDEHHRQPHGVPLQ